MERAIGFKKAKGFTAILLGAASLFCGFLLVMFSIKIDFGGFLFAGIGIIIMAVFLFLMAVCQIIRPNEIIFAGDDKITVKKSKKRQYSVLFSDVQKVSARHARQSATHGFYSFKLSHGTIILKTKSVTHRIGGIKNIDGVAAEIKQLCGLSK